MKTEFSRLELYALGEPFGDSATRMKAGGRGRILGSGGGGGGGQVKYENLEQLYAIQAKQGQQLMDMANNTVYPAYNELMNEAKGAGSLTNQNKAADTAGASVAESVGQAKQNLSDNLASMGVNPADARYSNSMAKLDMEGAAQKAAAQTGARDRQQQLGFAKLQDATSMGMGIGSQATAALNSAGGFASQASQMQMNQASMDQGARSNIAALAGRMMFKDGGEVKSRMCSGGMVRKFSGGGIVGAMGGMHVAPPPSSAPARSTGMGLVSGATSGATMGGGKLLARGIEKVGEATGSNAMQSFGAGMRLGDKAQPAIDAYGNAANVAKDVASKASLDATNAANYANELDMASSLAPTVEGAAAPTAEALAGAGTAATETAAAAATTAGAAEGLATTSAALGAGSAVAAALPWVGGAMLVGSALGLFKDGGSVNKRRLMGADQKGGAVSGPGGPKDDQVPALLSNGEFVMPVGTVQLYGKDKLEQMRQEGLAHEKQIGIGA